MTRVLIVDIRWGLINRTEQTGTESGAKLRNHGMEHYLKSRSAPYYCPTTLLVVPPGDQTYHTVDRNSLQINCRLSRH